MVMQQVALCGVAVEPSQAAGRRGEPKRKRACDVAILRGGGIKSRDNDQVDKLTNNFLHSNTILFVLDRQHNCPRGNFGNRTGGGGQC